MVAFADTYADQNDADFAQLERAANVGHLVVQDG
jgi:hypothetical protein